jgi:hypothetical protein
MGPGESKNGIGDAARLARDFGHVAGLVLVLAACGGSDNPAANEAAGQGGGGGTGTASGGATGAAGMPTGGSGGSTQPSECPSGTQCAAPLGTMVCSLTTTGYRPTCSAQQPCSFGQSAG